MALDVVAHFGLALPLVVAPLGGGPTTPALVAASCNAGALGTLACAYLEPQQIDAAVAATRAATRRPFAMNLFAPMPALAVPRSAVAAALAATRVYRDELALPEPALAPPYHPDFEGQLEAVLRARPAAFSVVFGALAAEHVQACRARGIVVIGCATTLDEALALEASGCDVVVAQGKEAGGHRAMFDARRDDPDVATLPLVRELARALRVPVVAAGGLMHGADIAAALGAGAVAAQLGTAFLLAAEAGTSAPYRAALVDPRRPATRLTRAFSGRLARGLENRFMRDFAGAKNAENAENAESARAILPFPLQNALTRDIRSACAARGSHALLSLWAGEGVAAILANDGLGAADIIARLGAELRAAR